MENLPDFYDEIMDHLRYRRGQQVKIIDLASALTTHIKKPKIAKAVRGKIMSNLNHLVKEKKVVAYPKIRKVRISEVWV